MRIGATRSVSLKTYFGTSESPPGIKMVNYSSAVPTECLPNCSLVISFCGRVATARTQLCRPTIGIPSQ